MLEGHNRAEFAVQCGVTLEELIVSIEVEDDDPALQQVRLHLFAGCTNCIGRLSIIRDLLRELIEPKSMMPNCLPDIW